MPLILVAEDDEAQGEVVKEILLADGYDVVLARSPDEVLECLAYHSPDLAMLDLHGITFPRVMDALHALPSPPSILIFSGDAHLAERAHQLGAEGFLSKPTDLEMLLETVRRALANRDALFDRAAHV